MHRHGALLALLLPALLLLSGCGVLLTPELEVEPGSALHLEPVGGGAAGTIRIGNAGSPHTVLYWQAQAEPAGFAVTPSHGAVRAGDPPQELLVTGPNDTPTSGVITIDSNAGSARVAVTAGTDPAHRCAAGFTLPASPNGLAGGPGSEFAPGELLVRYAAPLGPLSATERAEARQLRALAVRAEHQLELLAAGDALRPDRVAAADPLAVAAELERDPRVLYAHPNYYVTPQLVPDDPCFAEQWNLHEFGLPGAWSLGLGGAEVVVAVVDTGVDTEHEDLRGKVLPGWDAYDRDADPRPGPGLDEWTAHGTHVAGIVAAAGNNGVGVAGVAYGESVTILPVKVFDDTGRFATVADLVDGILWAAGLPVTGAPANPHPARIINLSLGAGARRVAALDEATRRAAEAGALLIGAAGNHATATGSNGVQSPANSPYVAAVGSVDSGARRSYFSDYGAPSGTVLLMAPGGFGPSGCENGAVRSTFPRNGYGCLAGTSMAAPFVAGVAALLLSREPDLDNAEVVERLAAGTYFDPEYMDEAAYGAGVLCAERALAPSGATRAAPCGSGTSATGASAAGTSAAGTR